MTIPGFSLYNITEAGIITRVDNNKPIIPTVTKSNSSTYLRVCLKDDNGKVRMHNVMKLVAETFLEKPFHNAVLQAKDGDNLNVHVNNIEYTSRSEISKKAWSDGKIAHRRSRQKCWTEDTLEYVLSCLNVLSPITMVDLSYEIKLPYSTIRYCVAELCNRGKVKKTGRGVEVISCTT